MKRLVLTCLLAMSVAATCKGQTILYVDPAIATPGNGLSWATAKKTLRDALAIAIGGSGEYEIRLADGIYKPDQALDFSITPGDRNEYFPVKPGFTIRGGYDSSTGDYDPTSFSSVLSGDIGTPSDPSDDSVQIVRNVGSGTSGVIGLESLTIEKTSPSMSLAAYGVDLVDPLAIVELSDVRVRDHGGGGLSIYAASVNLDRVSITNNDLQGGAAITTVDSGTVEMRDCEIRNNESSADSAIKIVTDGAVQIIHCQIANNQCIDGMNVQSPATFLVLRSIFHANTGSGLRIRGNGVGGIANVWYSYFSENMTSGSGGGMYCTSYPEFVVNNCVFRDNVAEDCGGGAIHSEKNAIHIVNCTIVNNHTDWADCGGGVYFDGTLLSRSTVSNTIFWDNTDDAGRDDVNAPGSNVGCGENNGCVCSDVDLCVRIRHSDVDAAIYDLNFVCCSDGDANIDADPLIAVGVECEYEQGGLSIVVLSLVSTSPCVDKGSNSLVLDDVYDVDDDANVEEVKAYDLHYLCDNSNFWIPRIVDGSSVVPGAVVDIGAYELGPQCMLADWNEDNTVDVTDIFAFLSAWFANCMASSPPCEAPCYCKSADFDGMNGIDVPDIFAFLSAWFAGCP